MRVIAGTYKSRLLSSVKRGNNLRPTLDKVKESIFNIIGDKIKDSKFLDLFSGTGNIGIEAISRGAKLTYFVENNKNNFNIIKKNLEIFNIDHSFYKLVYSDAYKFLKNYNMPYIFDIIFADPPYNKGHFAKTINFLGNFKGLSKETIIIFETDLNEKLELNNNCSFKIIKIKRYGDTNINILKRGG